MTFHTMNVNVVQNNIRVYSNGFNFRVWNDMRFEYKMTEFIFVVNTLILLM